MSIESRFFGSLVYPAYHALKRDGVNSSIGEYERVQWLGANELRKLEQSRLAALLDHAIRNVPFYRERYGTRDITQFAPLMKADIRGNLKKLLADGVQSEGLQWNTTSGSTGEPLYFYMDPKSDTSRKATVVRNKRWMGISPGDRELLLWGSPIDASRAALLRGRVHAWLARTRLVSAYDLSQARMQECIEQIHTYKPKLIVAYPSVLEELARAMQESSRRPSSVRAILVSAETLYPHQRALFESVFDAPVYNRYGCREVGDIAQECPQHQGLHINSDRVLVEVVRDDLSPCAPGEIGNVLVTDLDNRAMPLIRYFITDRAALAAPGECGCGRALPRLEVVEGRTLDVVRFPNGSAVGGTYWTILLRRRPGKREFHGMDQFQIVQQRQDEVLIRYVAEAPVSAAAADAIRKQVAQQAGPAFGVRFEQVTHIPVNVAGKKRIVVSEISTGVAVPVREERAPITEEEEH